MDPADAIQYDDLEQRAGRTLLDSEKQDLRKLADLAGSHARRMLESVEAAATFLQCNNRDLRRGAIQVLSWYWQVCPGTAPANSIVEIATSDRDPHVRREALSWLGVIYRGTDDVDVGALLARTVLNELEKVGTRKCAYDGLCCLRWRVKPSWAISRFPEAVDWSYVRTFLDTSRSAPPVDAGTALKQLYACSISSEEREISNVIHLLKDGLYEQAIEGINEVLKMEVAPGVRAFAHLLRAQAQIETGAIEHAIEDLSITVELDPYRREAYVMRSVAYQMLGKSERAREDKRRADEIGE